MRKMFTPIISVSTLLCMFTLPATAQDLSAKADASKFMSEMEITEFVKGKQITHDRLYNNGRVEMKFSTRGDRACIQGDYCQFDLHNQKTGVKRRGAWYHDSKGRYEQISTGGRICYFFDRVEHCFSLGKDGSKIYWEEGGVTNIVAAPTDIKE